MGHSICNCRSPPLKSQLRAPKTCFWGVVYRWTHNVIHQSYQKEKLHLMNITVFWLDARPRMKSYGHMYANVKFRIGYLQTSYPTIRKTAIFACASLTFLQKWCMRMFKFQDYTILNLDHWWRIANQILIF